MSNSRGWRYGVGIGLVALLVVGSQVFTVLDSWQTVGGIMLLAGLLLLLDRTAVPSNPPVANLPTRSELQEELYGVQAVITKIRSVPKQEILRNQVQRLEENIHYSNHFHIAVFGQKKVGKTALIEALKGILQPAVVRGQRKITMIETTDRVTAQAADLILLVIDGVMSASEYRDVLHLRQLQKRVLLVFNKKDLFLPSEQEMILAELWDHTREVLKKEDIFAIAAFPQPIKVRQSGKKEWLEPVPPDVVVLRSSLQEILALEWDALQMYNLQQKVRFLQGQARRTLYNDYRRDGEKIIQKYQWITAATVFTNPLSGLDLIANAAINTQMLLELGKAYDRPLTLQEAGETSTILAQSMLQLGCVELVTSTLVNILKFNTLTFALGGSMQAVTAAYLTRVGGISFMKYLEQQLPPIDTDRDLVTAKPLQVLCEETFTSLQGQPLLQTFLQEAALHITATEGKNSHNDRASQHDQP